MVLIGRDLTRERLRRALDALGGASEKERERWRREAEAAEAEAAS